MMFCCDMGRFAYERWSEERVTCVNPWIAYVGCGS